MYTKAHGAFDLMILSIAERIGKSNARSRPVPVWFLAEVRTAKRHFPKIMCLGITT